MKRDFVVLQGGQIGNPVAVNEEGLFNFIQSINGNTAKVFYYIKNNMDKRVNVFYGTYNSLSKELKLSRPTVAKIMVYLQSIGVLAKKQVGVWDVDINKAYEIKNVEAE